jgi:hypothetical protein
MPRRGIPILLAITLFATLTASATDFWVAKDWRQWSDDECINILYDSPWSHTWQGGHMEFVIPATSGSPTAAAAGMGFGPGAQLAYVIQIRSSLPVRRAIVRKLQFTNKYEKMTGDQRADFDAQAAKILNRDYRDVILVHVDFSRIGAGLVLSAQRTAVISNKDTLNFFLITDNGSQIKATRVDVDSDACTFDAIFPRLVSGVPTIKAGQRRFSIQFESPLLHVFNYQDIPAEAVKVHFDLTKMLVNGKPSF